MPEAVRPREAPGAVGAEGAEPGGLGQGRAWGRKGGMDARTGRSGPTGREHRGCEGGAPAQCAPPRGLHPSEMPWLWGLMLRRDGAEEGP